MKHILYGVFITLVLFACKSKTKETVVDSLVISEVDSTSLLIQKFKPIIQGAWVKSDYIKKVIVTSSPFAAADKATGITYIEIDTANIKGERLVAGVSYNNHEGGEIIIKFIKGETPETIQADSAELGYSVENGDTVLTLTEVNDAHDKVTTRYIRALNKPGKKTGNGMDYLINKNLFAGSYAMTDTIGKVRQVILTENGQITGITGFRTYYAMNDFIAGPMNNLDLLIFNLYAKDQKDYAFKISGNTLKLFDTEPTPDSSALITGKLIYTLIRNK
ncbi:hypothetical protein DJ568_13330 [Mucilaginibacter hurinus]|uniref:Uncharacterized protein n=1 Tax=Mucilaginibacter hurinus TaxID=2201324 RepID=A0A367GNK8_9SPHI|nr:hypothetical protein [Mucilaginibacter hurinus]RCH54273.1 hypothetical protein DJ568_13330 [Mucilaginibacter hurinus]